MILGWAKNLNVSPDYILYDISYENVIIYTRATPQYDDEKQEWDERLDANNPNNFNNDSDEEEFVT